MQTQVHMTTTMWATLALAHPRTPLPVLARLLATSPCVPASLPPPFYPEDICTLATLKQEDVHATGEDRHRRRRHGLPHMRRGHTSQTKSRSLESAEDLLQATSTNMTAVAASGPNAHHCKPA